jgi:hypothetical protein
LKEYLNEKYLNGSIPSRTKINQRSSSHKSKSAFEISKNNSDDDLNNDYKDNEKP